LARKKWYRRFPGLKRRKYKTDDSHFSSGEPDREEREEWADRNKGYKEKDCFKAYLTEVKNIPDCDAAALVKRKDKASNNRLIRAHLKRVIPIAYRIADEFGFKSSYNVIRDRKKAKEGYQAVVADLICSGNEGLLLARKRFRPDAGASFATAARWSIEKAIRAQALFLRHVVHVPEGHRCPWHKSLTWYEDDGNEYLGETVVAIGGVATSAFQVEDGTDPADSAIGGVDHAKSINDFVCLTDLDRAASSLLRGRERDIFRAHYIKGRTLKAIAVKYGIGFQRVSKIARAARDKILASEFAIHSVNLRAVLPQWREGEAWLDDLRRCNDVEHIRTRGRLAHVWSPRGHSSTLVGFGPVLGAPTLHFCRLGVGLKAPFWHGPFPLDTANRIALWRLAEFERGGINEGWWNRVLIARLKIAEKKERWRRRKNELAYEARLKQIIAVREEYGIDAKIDLGHPYELWDQLTPFHPPLRVPTLWTIRSTYPARIHVAGPPPPAKPEWVRPSDSWQFWPDLRANLKRDAIIERKRDREPSKILLKTRHRPPYYVGQYRALWKKRLEPDDWRIKYQRERHERFLSSVKQKEVA
jgi:RNA polymerase sigma factor (sigma-70 family)